MMLDQLVTNGDRDRLCPVMNAELGQDVLDVLGDGLAADHELAGDIRACVTGGQQGQDLLLTLWGRTPRFPYRLSEWPESNATSPSRSASAEG